MCVGEEAVNLHMCDFVCHNSHGHVVVLTISKIIHVIEVLHVHLVDPMGMVKVVVGAGV